MRANDEDPWADPYRALGGQPSRPKPARPSRTWRPDDYQRRDDGRRRKVLRTPLHVTRQLRLRPEPGAA